MKKSLLLALGLCTLVGCDDGKDSKTEEPADMAKQIAICSDDLDNNGNGKVDCADTKKCGAVPICKDGKRVTAENSEELCQDTYDNDLKDGADCADPACAAFEHCKSVEKEDTVEKCKDLKDNDKDGKIDCKDPECAKFEHCKNVVVLEDTQALCSNGIDDDNDGTTDCEDDGCKSFSHCSGKIDYKGENTFETCQDTQDNEGDGMVDCADPECSTFQHCMGKAKPGESSEADCKNSLDDDGDGFTDCAEAACQQFSHCTDACPEDPFKFVTDKCPCGETLMPDDTCAKNITTKEELLAYVQDYSKPAVLKLDIDLGNNSAWKPIGSESKPFSAKFYGAAKRIGGVLQCVANTKYCGIFGSAKDASFVNIDVAVSLNNKVENQENYIGGLLGYGDTVTIKDMKVPAKVVAEVTTVTAPGNNKCKAGAYSGALAGALKNSTVTNIQVSGSSSAQSKYFNTVVAGGVVGSLQKSTMSKVQTSATTTAYLAVLSTTEYGLDCPHVLAGGVVGFAEESTLSEINYNSPVKAYITDGFATLTIPNAFASPLVVAGGAVAMMKTGRAEKLRGEGKIEAAPDDSSFALRSAAGGVVGILDSGVVDIALFKGEVFAKAIAGADTARKVYAGGIVGQAKGTSTTPAQLFNVEAQAKITGQTPSTQAAGGLVGGAEYCNVSNALSKSIFYSYIRASQTSNYIGGLIGEAKETKLVNTYAKADIHVEEGTETAPVHKPIVGALVSKSEKGYLYDSYWSKQVAPEIIIITSQTQVDTTCLEYTVNASADAKPNVLGTSLLSKLLANLGRNGVVSPNIPKASYLPWIEKTDTDGKWPVLDFDAAPFPVGL